MIHVRDAAYAAYQAAQSRDLDTARTILADLCTRSRSAIEAALRLCSDRTLTVMRAADPALKPGVGHALIWEADSSGETVTSDLLPPAMAWAGQIFNAHLCQDDALWDALMAAVPPTDTAMTEYAVTMLHMLVVTADSYAELSAKPDGRFGAEQLAARAALCHLN